VTGPRRFAEGVEEAAGADGRELCGVADEDRLPAGFLDEAQDGSEDARLRHARLVDDEHRAVGEASLVARVEVEPVQRSTADPGGTGELVGGTAARRRSEDGNAGILEDAGEELEGGCLAGAGDSDGAEDPVGAEAAFADERALLGGEAKGSLVCFLPWEGAGRAGVSAGERQLEGLALDVKELAGREPRRPAG
jgi:hypothetical protein